GELGPFGEADDETSGLKGRGGSGLQRNLHTTAPFNTAGMWENGPVVYKDLRLLSTLDRYLLREVIQTWVSVTFVLLLIMLTSRFARYLGEAAGGNLAADAVFALLGLTSIHYLTVLVPVSLFLAVMLAFGRLYKDSEMAALMACGVGYGRLLRPLTVLGAFAAVGLAVLSMGVSPWAGRMSEEVRHAAAREAEAAGFEPGRF